MISESVNILSAKGFKVFVTDDAFSAGGAPFFAAPKDYRTKDFISALEDNSVKIIGCFRGGYGAGELQDKLIKVQFKTPKVLIGFSDPTVLHAIFNNHYKLPSIHGPNIVSIVEHPELIDEVLNVIAGKDVTFGLTAINDAALKAKPISSVVTGGNLTMLTTLLGTKIKLLTKGKILFLEDVGTKGYQVHRLPLHLKNAGVLSGVSAVIFGDFVNCVGSVEEAISLFCKEYLKDVPCFKAKDFGHGDANRPCVFRYNAFIADGNLTVKSPFSIKGN